MLAWLVGCLKHEPATRLRGNGSLARSTDVPRQPKKSAHPARLLCGTDRLLIEVHPRPEEAQSDGLQSLKLDKLRRVMKELSPLVEAVGRWL